LDAFNGTPIIDIKPYDPYDVFPGILAYPASGTG
jgi:tRNA (Thr-GGU) A37 N-methylase